MNQIIINWFVLLIFIVGCGPDDEPVTADPANLTINVSVSESIPGLVNVNANAEKTVEYTFDAGDGSEVQKNTSGQFTHTYGASNFYTVEIRAYGENGRYLLERQQIAVELENGSSGDDGYTTPISYQGMTLLWQDEFAGTGVDETKWTYELGDGCPNLCGWGNNEQQYYQKENATVADGYIAITAKQQTVNGKSYTSSRLTTKDKFEFKYGRVDIRAKMPKGQGMWPAVWMLGANIDSNPWPACGEIDIVEMVGKQENTAYGTIHYEDGGHAEYGGKKVFQSGNFLNEKFHVFTLIWDEDTQSITWLVDDQQLLDSNNNPLRVSTTGPRSEFQEEFFLIMNVAVGGNWPGNPDASTAFPQQMIVDYIRVFQPE